MNEDVRGHRWLVQATGDDIRRAVGTEHGIAYELPSISLQIFSDILDDVSVRQPRTDDTKREQLRNSEEG